MQKLGIKMAEHQYLPGMIFNFDETMLHPGKKRLKVLMRAGCRKPIEKILSKGKHISFGLCISADGTYLQPLVIFPLKTCPNLTGLAIHFFAITGQENGWMTKEGYKNWLIHVFIPGVWAKRQAMGDLTLRALLFIDGHSSRDNDETTALCAQNLIDVVCFLSHSSATCQPLDLGVNGAFKAILSTHYKIREGEDAEERRARLLSVSTMCLASAMTPLYILEGFSKTGIFPFSVEAPLSSELVVDPIEKIDPLPPKKRKRGHGISGKFLTDGKPLPTVYLCTAPPGIPPLPPVPQGNDFLFNPEEITFV